MAKRQITRNNDDGEDEKYKDNEEEGEKREGDNNEEKEEDKANKTITVYRVLIYFWRPFLLFQQHYFRLQNIQLNIG